MRGSSTQIPEQIVQHGGGYQFRFNIEQMEREVDGQPVTEYQYDYINVPFAAAGYDVERCYRKTVRAYLMDTLTVTTASGKVFDADETSQTRMTRVLAAADAIGQPDASWSWGLADNTVATITVAEMREALALAMQAQSDIWFV
jgi:hypothetical protein